MIQTRRAAVALAGVFGLFGVLVGTWVSRIPAVKDGIGLDNRTLGLALLGWPLGSVCASVLIPGVLSRLGSRPVVVGGSLASAATLVLPTLADSAVALAGAMFLFGLATGVLDIAANTHGAAVEAAHGTSVFSRLHASWSAGAFVGGGVGALVAAAGIGIRTHFVVIATAVAACGFFGYPSLLAPTADRRFPGVRAGRAWSVDRTVLLLGGVALAAFVVEAAVADWAAIYLHENVGTTAAAGAAGYATFAAVHLTGRYFGDQVLTRLGRVRVMIGGFLLAAAGYVLLLAIPVAGSAFAALAVIGAGIAAVVPAAFGSAGRLVDPPSAVAVSTVTGISYIGWAAAPPLIGVLAGQFGLRAALLVPLGLAVLGALWAVRLAARVTLVEHAEVASTTTTPR